MTQAKNILALFALAALAACGETATKPTAVKVGQPYTIDGKTYTPEAVRNYQETGIASWYGPGFHGKKTANGEEYNKYDYTAAHPTLPLPSIVRVTNLENGKQVRVRINDRGPFVKGRIIDLSYAAAQEIGVSGLAMVKLEYLERETQQYWADNDLSTKQVQYADEKTKVKFPPPKSEAERQLAALDGVRIPADDEPDTSTAQPAPMMSVASNDIKSERKTNFNLVSDAQAATLDEDKAPAPLAPVAGEGNVTQRPVRLVGPDGKPLSSTEVAEHEATQEGGTVTFTEPSPAAGSLWVQAGAFSSEANAKRLMQRLKSVGNAVMIDVDSGGKILHRVRVGPFADRAQAEKAMDAAVKAGATGAKIVDK